MKRIWIVLALIGLVGCGVQSPAPADPSLVIGGPEEKNAVAEVKALAAKNGYHPEKYEVIVRVDKDLGNFLIFLFPRTKEKQVLDRRTGIFAIVKASSGQVIEYSDPAHDKNKPLSH